MEANVKWNGGMKFEAENRGILSKIDLPTNQDGENTGPTPKEIVLNAMCTCAGIDVVSIAKKMRLELKKFSMKANAKTTTTIPSYFASVHIDYLIEGEIPSEKIVKAVVLSMTKYCGVSYMISKNCPITYAVHLNNEIVFEETAQFKLEVI